MLTARGWWLLFASGLVALVGVTTVIAPVIAILGLTLLAWIIIEWIVFAIRVRFALPKLSVERVVTQNGRIVTAGWADLPFQVRFMVSNRSRLHCPLLRMTDIHTTIEKTDSGTDEIIVALPPGGKKESNYVIHPRQPGELYFSGVCVTMQDLNGFFRASSFIVNPTSILVLPRLTDEQGRHRADKRFNALPPPGTHRLRMPGSGGELLDLRDYRPGDPPKMIAWKPSARRDRLITKEYESEVPVRCVIFLDEGNSVRIGAGEETALAKLATTAAGILLAATANRDLVGLNAFDAKSSRAIKPARSASHATQLLGELARSAARFPDVPETDPVQIVRRLEPALRERSSELFDMGVNARPWGLYWRPLLDTRWGWLVFVPMLLSPYLAIQPFWLNLSAHAARRLNPATGTLLVDFLCFLGAFVLTLALPATLALLFWLSYGLSGALPTDRRRKRRRKQVAAIFAAMDRDSPAAVERYLHDDAAFAERAGRYFAAERLRVPAQRFDSRGRDRFHEPAKVVVAATSLVRATTRARDNELYVILADLIDSADELEPLIRAARLARTRHHHVLVIVAWPKEFSTERPTSPLAGGRIRDAVAAAVEQGVWRKYDLLRRRFLRAGATVLRLTDRDTVRTVLDHLDRLRGARSRR